MTVPWHQDNAYVSREAWGNMTVVAWIPLVNASEHNGCMQVLKGGHRTGQTATHTCCQGGTWYVEMDEADAAKRLHVDTHKDVVTCPMPAGSILLMNAHSKFVYCPAAHTEQCTALHCNAMFCVVSLPY